MTHIQTGRHRLIHGISKSLGIDRLIIQINIWEKCPHSCYIVYKYNVHRSGAILRISGCPGIPTGKRGELFSSSPNIQPTALKNNTEHGLNKILFFINGRQTSLISLNCEHQSSLHGDQRNKCVTGAAPLTVQLDMEDISFIQLSINLSISILNQRFH